MVCGYWDISVITCLLLVLAGVVSMSDVLPSPENLNLSLSSDHSLILQWSRPAGLDANCEVTYQIELYLEKCPPSGEPNKKWRTVHLNRTLEKLEMEMCFKIFTQSSNCPNKNPSKPLFKGLSQHPAVKNLSCVYYSRMKMNCSWNLISEVSDLQLFYGKEGILKPCVSYIGNGLMKTGCHLYGEEFLNHTYHFLVKGTDKGVDFQNHFDIESSNLVKIPPLKLNITADQKYIYFHSSQPDFGSKCWKYNFYYKKCNEDEKEISGEQHKQHLEYDDSCSYTARVQAIFEQFCGVGESEMSETVSYGRNKDPNWPLKMAVIIIPLSLSFCLIVGLLLCRRHKDIIFPKIPAPQLLLKDVLNSNKDKCTEVGNLYEPHEDVVEKIFKVELERTFLNAESTNEVPPDTLSVNIYKCN